MMMMIMMVVVMVMMMMMMMMIMVVVVVVVIRMITMPANAPSRQRAADQLTLANVHEAVILLADLSLLHQRPLLLRQALLVVGEERGERLADDPAARGGDADRLGDDLDHRLDEQERTRQYV
jgi:hypothetical protein